jgi:hypothetical protein
VLFGTVLLALLMSGWRYHGKPTISITWSAQRLARWAQLRKSAGPPVVAYWLSRPIPPEMVQHCSVLCSHDGHSRHSLSCRRPVDPSGCRIGIDHESDLWGWALRRRPHVRAASEIAFRRICFALIAAAIALSAPVLDNFTRQRHGQWSFECRIDRDAIAVRQPVGLVGHADDGQEFAKHRVRHAGLAGGSRVARNAIFAAIGHAHREIQ